MHSHVFDFDRSTGVTMRSPSAPELQTVSEEQVEMPRKSTNHPELYRRLQMPPPCLRAVDEQRVNPRADTSDPWYQRNISGVISCWGDNEPTTPLLGAQRCIQRATSEPTTPLLGNHRSICGDTNEPTTPSLVTQRRIWGAMSEPNTALLHARRRTWEDSGEAPSPLPLNQGSIWGFTNDPASPGHTPLPRHGSRPRRRSAVDLSSTTLPLQEGRPRRRSAPDVFELSSTTALPRIRSMPDLGKVSSTTLPREGDLPGRLSHPGVPQPLLFHQEDRLSMRRPPKIDLGHCQAEKQSTLSSPEFREMGSRAQSHSPSNSPFDRPNEQQVETPEKASTEEHRADGQRASSTPALDQGKSAPALPRVSDKQVQIARVTAREAEVGANMMQAQRVLEKRGRFSTELRSKTWTASIAASRGQLWKALGGPRLMDTNNVPMQSVRGFGRV